MTDNRTLIKISIFKSITDTNHNYLYLKYLFIYFGNFHPPFIF